MGVTDCMDDVDYDLHDFRVSQAQQGRKHPLRMTHTHSFSPLLRNADNEFEYLTDVHGHRVQSPRSLREIASVAIITSPPLLRQLPDNTIPAHLYPGLLTEAVFQQELPAVQLLISSWSLPSLSVMDIMPLEEVSQDSPCEDVLTEAVWGGCSLLDSFILGLLNICPRSPLTTVDFTNFSRDRKLCRELARLPVLWLQRHHPTLDYTTLDYPHVPGLTLDLLHAQASSICEVTREKLQRYLNKIALIYSSFEAEATRTNASFLGPVTVVLECKVTLEDVPLGLALQHLSPFRFAASRLWLEHIPDACLPLHQLHRVIHPQAVSQLEVYDGRLQHDALLQQELVGCLGLLPSLTALALPSCLDVASLDTRAFNKALRGIPGLRRLNLSQCNLRHGLSSLLAGTAPLLAFLALTDCRLAEDDLRFLLAWHPTEGLRELHVSRNVLSACSEVLLGVVARLGEVRCLSCSYCSLDAPQLTRLLALLPFSCPHLRALALQSFTPPPHLALLNLTTEIAELPALQCCMLLPEAYAFPGADAQSREYNRTVNFQRCVTLMQHLHRPDIWFE